MTHAIFAWARILLILAGLGAAVFSEPAASSATFETPATLIRNVLIVDGSGAAPVMGSVRIRGDRIVAVGQIAKLPADRELDAGGLALAPGFIDAHSHHDRGLEKQPTALAAISQGITTIVVGQDGQSNLPLSRYFVEMMRKPAAVNLASFSGHNSIRKLVLGDDFKRAANSAEIRQMARLLEMDMRDGALGLSTGLEYDPGFYANDDELHALARTAASSGGRYISHMRSEDLKLWQALDEVIRIGESAQMPVQVSHAKLAMIPLWGQAPRMLAKMDEARRKGIAITADVYPYTYWQSTLQVLFPDRDFKDRSAAEFALSTLTPAEGLRLSRFRPDPSLVGMTVAEISRRRGTDPAQTLMDLIAAAPTAGDDEMVIGTSMRDDDLATLITWPHASICSDGKLDDLHPRGAGAFTKVLREYVRERKLLSLQAAIHKMTGLTASNLGIRDRGIIRPGAYADLILFDPAKVADRATIKSPGLLSVGIERLWVNGRVVLDGGRPTGLRPGRVIKRSAS